jgi:hypothetical protein
MKIRTSLYLMKEAFVSLKRNALMSFASISTVAVSLLVLGAFGILGRTLAYDGALRRRLRAPVGAAVPEDHGGAVRRPRQP